MYEAICDAIHRELDVMDEKLASGKTTLNSQDLEHIDKMAHALKCLKTYEAMEGHSDYDSYARGRSRTTGRYRDEYSDRRY